MCFLLLSPLLFISNSVDLRVIVVGDLGSLGPKSHIIQLGLGADDHSSLPGKLLRSASILISFGPRDLGTGETYLEVGACCAKVYLPN